jgi:glutamine amidotransferase-like uncharacterized protein
MMRWKDCGLMVVALGALSLQGLAARGQQPVAKLVRPIRVAVYDDKGSPRTPSDMERVVGGDTSLFTVRLLSAKEIREGGLAGFDVLVQGGGNSIVQSKELKEDGREAIRSFVRGGGGYVGICGGAHFTVPGDALKLGILNARVVDDKHWARGRGDVILDVTPEGQKELHEPAKTTVMYHQGPLLAPGDRTDLPPYTLLATYETEVAKNGAPHGVMRGTAAIASSMYGKGRVFVFGPHPEQTRGQEGMVRAALLWAAARTEVPLAGQGNGAVVEGPAAAPVPVMAAQKKESTAVSAPAIAPQQEGSTPVALQASGDSGCCGPITPKGQQLMAYLDSLHVDHLWPQHTFVNWETGEPTPSHGRHEPKTHCAAFAAAAAERLNIFMMRPPYHSQSELAAAQERYFQSSRGVRDGWRPVHSSEEAQGLTNEGEFVVLVYGNPNPHKAGHIAIVRPAVKSMKALNDEGPQTTQAGGHNFSSGTAKYSFVFHRGAWPNEVMMFAHVIDFAAPRYAPTAHDASQDAEDSP